jgi:hypothetical protein
LYGDCHVTDRITALSGGRYSRYPLSAPKVTRCCPGICSAIVTRLAARHGPPPRSGLKDSKKHFARHSVESANDPTFGIFFASASAPEDRTSRACRPRSPSLDLGGVGIQASTKRIKVRGTAYPQYSSQRAFGSGCHLLPTCQLWWTCAPLGPRIFPTNRRGSLSSLHPREDLYSRQ